MVRHPQSARLLARLARSVLRATLYAYRTGLVGRGGTLAGLRLSHGLSRLGLRAAFGGACASAPPGGNSGAARRRSVHLSPSEAPVRVLKRALHPPAVVLKGTLARDGGRTISSASLSEA